MNDEMYPICGSCEKGRLLPFPAPNGMVVYFCTHCLKKFSGYVEEPTLNGSPIYAEMASYSTGEERGEEACEESPYLEEYEKIFLTYLPEMVEEEVYCPLCEAPMVAEGVAYVCRECGYRD